MSVSKLERVREQIAHHCCDISDLFVAGAQITVIVRSPHGPDGDIIVTTDTLPNLMRSLIAAMEREPTA